MVSLKHNNIEEATQQAGQFDADLYIEALRADELLSSPDIQKLRRNNTKNNIRSLLPSKGGKEMPLERNFHNFID